MENRHSFIMGALVAIVGVVVGAGSASFAGSRITGALDPNRAHEGFRPVAQEGSLETKRAVVRDRFGARRISSFQNPTAQGQATHAAAGTDPADADTSHCEGLTGPKLNRCVTQAIEQAK